MTLEHVLKSVPAMVGTTSIIEALLGGDLKSVENEQASIATTRADAQAKVDGFRKAMADARSDAAWWGYAASHSYWRMVVDVLDAAALVGADDLPDVPLPTSDGVVMDVMSQEEKFGAALLAAAKARAADIDLRGVAGDVRYRCPVCGWQVTLKPEGDRQWTRDGAVKPRCAKDDVDLHRSVLS